MKMQIKKNRIKINKKPNLIGNEVRKSYQNVILDKAPVFPKPLSYDDIDKAMFDLVDNIDIVVNGEICPTFTLFSNQRFSEYSQMWEYSNEEGNLYLNFKTVNREKNPSTGSNQGNLWNIPGKRDYKLYMREILDENGIECYEMYTMKQPFCVDLQYSINFVTNTFEKLNEFNQKLNDMFSSRQCYIRPNGHYIPIILEQISDDTSYSVADRKFFVQSVSLKVMAYIINKEDFQVKRFPKRTKIELDNIKKRKTCVEVNEDYENKTLHIETSFLPFYSKTEFVIDTDMVVDEIKTENIRNFRVMVNDVLYYTDKTFKLKNGDKILIKIKQLNYELESKIIFNGYGPNSFIKKNDSLE